MSNNDVNTRPDASQRNNFLLTFFEVYNINSYYIIFRLISEEQQFRPERDLKEK